MMRFLPTVRSTLVPRRVFVMGPNTACFIATQANRPRSIVPTEARLPNLLALLPKKPGGEINPHLKETETAFNTWVEKKLGRRCAMVCACVYRSVPSLSSPLSGGLSVRLPPACCYDIPTRFLSAVEANSRLLCGCGHVR